MAKLIREVRKPHDCDGELRRDFGAMDLWPGSIAECSCGTRFMRRENQRDGLYWAPAPVGEPCGSCGYVGTQPHATNCPALVEGGEVPA